MRHLTTLVLLFSSFSLLAQTGVESDATPKYSNEFLQIGVGARSLGMSNSVIASTTDITAGY